MRINVSTGGIVLLVLVILSITKMFIKSSDNEVKPKNTVELYEEPEYEGYEEEPEEIIKESKLKEVEGIIIDSHYLMELAFYEGQKDALEGRIRIELTESGKYRWIESPWDDGKKPKFDPLTVKDDE